jgi:hypothetical protein
MSTYTFSSLVADVHLDYDPAVDIFRFDSASITASAVQLLFTDVGLGLSHGGKTIWLDGVSAAQLAGLANSNFSFANGSALLVGDATLNPLADYYGQVYKLTSATTVNQ